MIALLLWLAGWGAEDDFERGMELARARSLQQARQAFQAGYARAPLDKRFPLELAGLAYLENDLPAAKRYLRRALRLDPGDVYANDFLGSLYFLEDNPEAALKYWNRARKPWIAGVAVEAGSLDPILIDRALAFSPAAVLTLEQYRLSLARLGSIGAGRDARLDLAAEPGDQFRVTLRALEPSKWSSLAGLARGLPFQTLHVDLSNPGGAGGSWRNLLRWDARRRRLWTSFAAPLGRNPKWGYRFHADLRRETWNTGGADFRMDRTLAGFEIRSVASERLSWQSGFEASWRDFRDAPALRRGFALKYRAGADYELLRLPESRVRLVAGGAWELGRGFLARSPESLSGPRPQGAVPADSRYASFSSLALGTGARAAVMQGAGLFSRLEASLAGEWLPKPYSLRARLRLGGALGPAPFDELFSLGMDRDHDLLLRGVSATRFGKKGGGPLGRDYVLANWDADREIFSQGLVAVRLGPFVDTGKVSGGA
ncbi:MAG: hypothetical protein FJW37_12785, partial [Acidobacteria bacterium]|nr:hypothetical protein [Acidobacteriota bacterium]